MQPTAAPTDRLTVIIPVRHDDAALTRLLKRLSVWRLRALVVDGAASCGTARCVKPPHTYLTAPASRGGQIAAGVAQADTPWLWVLHADSEPSQQARDWLLERAATDTPAWGRFDVHLPGLSLIATFMNWRSRLTRICTGDQGMFFHTALLDRAGGFPKQPLMEDIEVSKRLKRAAPAAFSAPRATISASPRRWRQQGVIRTVATMWLYRLSYFFGATPERLVQRYYGQSPDA